MKKLWVTEGFEAFRKGDFGNGGANLYVSKAGVLQRIYQYDLNQDGYFDLVFANCQNHHEAAPAFVYKDPPRGLERSELPAQGSVSGAVADLTGDGFADIIVCGRYDMAAPFASSDIYFGSEDDYSEKRHIKIPTPWAESMAVGNFRKDRLPSLAFAMPFYKTVRVFSPTELGIEWARFTDLPIECDLVTAGDLDGDGYDELITRMKDSTELTVYWGGPRGIQTGNFTKIPALPDSDIQPEEEERTLESAMERRLACPRLSQVVRLGGKNYLTLSSGKAVIFYGADEDRKIRGAFSVNAPMALAVAAGDINGDGFEDIAVACRFKDPSDKTRQLSFIYWGGEKGFSEERRTAVGTLQACDAALGDLDDDGFDEVIFCQSGANRMYTNDSLIFKGNADGVDPAPVRLPAEDARRVFIVKNKGKKAELVFINHYSRSSVGFDKTYIYHGGPDGYSPERREEVPCWCAVDSLSCDLNDDGRAELVVCNNSENSLHLDPGSHVHHFGPGGFEPEKSYLLPTKMGWGAVCADFNRDGYLDLAFVYNHYKDLIVFHGGPDGFKKSAFIELKKEDGTHYGSPRWICAADLNKNGWLDLIVPLCDSGRTLILWGGPDGFSLERKTELAVFHGACVRAADLTKNGYPDLIIGSHVETPKNGELTPHNPHHSFLHIYWNGPGGLSESNKTVLRADACDALCVADFNNDGWLDIFACSYHGGKDRDVNSFLYWNRKGVFHELDRQILFTHSASGCIAADFNEDGYVDLAVANHKVWGDHKGFSSVWWNGPGGFTPGNRTDLPTCGPHGMSSAEPGNQLDRGPEEYYTSAPFELPAGAEVSGIAWDGETPPKTWVRAQMRFADSEAALAGAEWRGLSEGNPWLEANQTVPAEYQKGRWIQCKLALGAVNSLRSPRLTRVTVSYTV
jgi:hypothetical protein